jgi:hypothetical protein
VARVDRAEAERIAAVGAARASGVGVGGLVVGLTRGR